MFILQKDTTPLPLVETILNNITLRSNPSKNILGVYFDSKLSWAKPISNTISKANMALHAIRLIKKFFNTLEILQLLTSNFYSIFYYNSEIWHILSLKPEIKQQQLLSASAQASGSHKEIWIQWSHL